MASENINVLRSILFTNEESFLIRNNGEQVSVDEVEGKIVGIYILSNDIESSREFTDKLKGFYKELKEIGESFEIVSVICHETDEESFKQIIESLPWLIMLFNDERVDTLFENLDTFSIPMLSILGKGGEIIRSNVCNLIEDHGIYAFPFSPEKLAEFDAIEDARLKAQTLESLLVDGEKDTVIGKDGSKVYVSELVGKTILFYFSSYDCQPCQRFKPKLLKAYNEIKTKDTAFDIIYVPCDQDDSKFNESYSTMPWLTLPFGDQRKKSLMHKLKVPHIPTLVAVGPNGRTITYKTKDLIIALGSGAYPFDEDHLKEIVEGWPKRLNHELHPEHELVLTPQDDYFCDACHEGGSGWSFHCKVCDFDLEPKCALEKK